MKKSLFLLALFALFLTLSGPSRAFTPAVSAKKQPSQDRILRCKEAFKASGIQKNGYQSFMKNCLKRKIMPIRP